MVVTPIIGRVYNRVPPAVIVAIGVVFFVVGSFQLSQITLLSSTGDIVLPMLVTGVGFACLFIPLTTAALTFVPRSELADAAGLSSFIRQIGGSIGLTVFATMLGRYAVRAKASVSWHVTSLRPEVASQLAATKRALMAHGVDPIAAQATALRAMAGKVGMQGMVLAFEKTFLLQGVVFLIVLPLLLFLRVERSKTPAHIDLGME